MRFLCPVDAQAVFAGYASFCRFSCALAHLITFLPFKHVKGKTTLKNTYDDG